MRQRVSERHFLQFIQQGGFRVALFAWFTCESNMQVLNWMADAPRRVLALIALCCVALLAFGMYLQHVVGLEPCPMCSGVILNARVGQVVYGAADPLYGCLGSRLNLAHLDLGAAPKLTAGVLAGECAALLGDFFRSRRKE